MTPSLQGIELPWGDCKIAFDLDYPDPLWAATEAGELRLPKGWSLNEVDGVGARWVSVFRVEDVVPTPEDAITVLGELVRIGALPPDYAIPARPTPSADVEQEARELLANLAYRDGCREKTRDEILYAAPGILPMLRVKASVAIEAIEHVRALSHLSSSRRGDQS